MKKVAAVLVAVVGLAVFAGCSTDRYQKGSDFYEPKYHGTFEQPLPDGRTVLCVYAKSYNSGGPSCDWANAK